MIGRVVKGIGGFYYVSDGNSVTMGKARGNLKRQKNLLYVGDIVQYDIQDSQDVIIDKVVRRDNFLIRPPVSNLDMLVVTFAASSPEPNFVVIDKLGACCELKNIEVCICITKVDMVTDDVLADYVSRYSSVYKVVKVNGITGEGMEELKAAIRGKNVALAGPSGVGKSTMLNNIIGENSQETGSISDKTGRGRHTTRHVEIFELEDGTNLYDTPGFTSLELPEIDAYELGLQFPEFRKHRGECKYADCIHINEPECVIKEAIESGEISDSRYRSYLAMMEEVKKWQK